MGSKRYSWLSLFAVVVLAGCRVDGLVTVRSAEDGSGAVTISVTLDRAATEAVGDLDAILQAAHPEQTGWDASVRRAGDGVTLVAKKDFEEPEEVQEIVEELSGTSGPLGGLRLDVDAALFTIESRFTGEVDLREDAVRGFRPTDRAVIATLDGLGLDEKAVRDHLRGGGDVKVTMAVMIDLPGNEGHNGHSVVRTVPRWDVALGSLSDVSASSTQGRWTRIAPFSAALVAIMAVVITVWLRRRRRATPTVG